MSTEHRDYLNSIEQIETSNINLNSHFKLNHLDIELSSEQDTNHSSHVLNELSKEVLELQNKLKLSYRRLFIFETENQKLLKDKNFYFYEMTHFQEKLKLNQELIEKQKNEINLLSFEFKKATERIHISEKIIETQSSDLRRMNKFYDKIKTVIKPFVHHLKLELSSTKSELQKLTQIRIQHLEVISALEKKNSSLDEENKIDSQRHSFEKNKIIQTYEEQIHFLSKNTLESEQIIIEIRNENLRLKKLAENKNSLENDVIRFKRIHSEDQNKIEKLSLQLNDLSTQLTKSEFDQNSLTEKINGTQNELEQTVLRLQMTQKQLLSKIEDNQKLEMRLNMLEKLNINLSQNK